jgi:uracil-DNA glycosylase
MRISQCVGCKDFPCADVKHESYLVPEVEVEPSKVRLAMISEAAPSDAADYYYAPGEPLYGQTTVLAFRDAGVNVSSMHDLVDRGFYFSTAVKCGKQAYGLSASTVRQCSHILEQELALFPSLSAIMLMGDVAIKALNHVARGAKEGPVIPSGPTYRMRSGRYFWRGRRVFPSYLQAGPAFFIEKSKRRMIAEDIRGALESVSGTE